MATVSVYYAPGNRRSRLIAEAAYAGLRRAGYRAVMRESTKYDGIVSDFAVFYGLAAGLHKVFNDYKTHATAVYIDLGYWHRRIRDRYDGYHKISVNSRHPTAYFQNKKHEMGRFKRLNLEIKPWVKEGRDILIAGMSAKAAAAEGLIPFHWEQNAYKAIRGTTRRPVIYRPKPNCTRARPLHGAGFDKKTPLNAVLSNCHAIATHHSNVAVDALLRGVPAFCEEGVALPMSLTDLSLIEDPYYPDNRAQWAADIAWTQFTPAEMAIGLPWRHLREEGLIP